LLDDADFVKEFEGDGIVGHARKWLSIGQRGAGPEAGP